MPSTIERWLPGLFLAFLLLLGSFGAWLCRDGWPISSNLLDLLPHTQRDVFTSLAEERIQEPLSRQLIAVAGNTDPALAVQAARGLAKEWQESGLFSRVQLEPDVDIEALRAQLMQARITALPFGDRQLLQTDPAAFTALRARELMDPFSATSVVPIDQDWLGLAKRTETALAKSGGTVQFDLESGTLQAQAKGKTWVLLRAQTEGDAFDQQTPARIQTMIARNRTQLQDTNTEFVVTGGMLYAAAAREQAMKESSWMGAGSVIGILIILILALRRGRAVLALVPVAVGMLTGFVACVALFGSIHVLTLVIGASLIGVVVDYPLHWLGKSYGLPRWRPWTALRSVRTGLTLSLATSLIGYLALALTPFPALTQSAVFSVAGLLGAYACTVCLLPACFKNWQPAPWGPFLRGAQTLLALQKKFSGKRRWAQGSMLAVALLCILGLTRLSVHDDMRQWFSLPQTLTDDAQQIGKITGFIPTSQFFLVRAPDIDSLLERQEMLSHRLDSLVQDGQLISYSALSQLSTAKASQDRVRRSLTELGHNESALRPLEALGIPARTLQAHIATVLDAATPTLHTALAAPLGERWRTLWLGESEGIVAGMITLQGLRNVDALQPVTEGIAGATLVDRTGELNAMFSSTRVAAAELKLASYFLAGLLLWFFMGRSAAWRILAVPLAATLFSLATLGYLGQPLTLFSLFGLLLVTAIGVDYAIFIYEQVGGATASLIGIGLGGVTTLLSFGLLALSATPALSDFGLAVALGVLFSLLLAPWVHYKKINKDNNATT